MLGGEFRAVEIAARQADAAEAQFARHADRLRPQAVVEDVALEVGDGRAERDVAAHFVRVAGQAVTSMAASVGP